MLLERRLSDISPGETACVSGLRCDGGIRRRFLDIGLIQGTRVECLGRSPGGDPSAFLIRDAVIAIRERDSRSVLIE